MSQAKKAVVILAPGFEEIEAMAPVDILRRGGVEVILAGLNGLEVEGAHGVVMRADCRLVDVPANALDLVVLPGGMPGAKHLAESPMVAELLRVVHGQERLVAAICAAPMALDAAGLLIGREFTCYPSVEKTLHSGTYREETVVICDRIITSRGPATAMAFGFALLEQLGLATEAEALREGMLVK